MERMLPKLELAVILMYLSILVKVFALLKCPVPARQDPFEAVPRPPRLFFASTAVSTEMPTLASHSAGISLIPSPKETHRMPVLTQGGNQTDLLTRVSSAKHEFFNHGAKFAVCHFIQIGAGQHGFGRNPHPAAYRDRHVRLIPVRILGVTFSL